MASKKIGRRTVTVIREPARRDKLDDATSGPAAEHDITGCAILPRASQEEGKGWVILRGRMVVAPHGADILATDKVRYEGKIWDVEGEPGDYEDKKARGKATIFNIVRQGQT